jgi:hypothetical protein
MPEAVYRHVVSAEALVDCWFNPDPARFAMIPRDDGSLDPETAKLLDAMVEECAAKGTQAAQEELLNELFDLHAQMIVLWPLGFLWGRSPIGDVNEQFFARVLSEVDPHFVAVRSDIIALPRLASMEKRRGAALSFAIWKILAALRYSSDHVHTLDEIEDVHVAALAEILRPDGAWADWTTIWTQRYSKQFVRLMGDIRQDPHFGRVLDKTSIGLRGTRNANLYAAYLHLRWIDKEFERWLDERPLLAKRGFRPTKRLLTEAFTTRPPETVKDLRSAFSRENVVALLDYATTWSTPNGRVLAMSRILDFGKWLVDDRRNDAGKSPVKMMLTESDLTRFKSRVGPSVTTAKGGDVAAKPMPAKFHADLKRIITENDFAWPKSLISGYDQRPSQWTSWLNPETGLTEPVFCEVLPRMLLVMLDLPLRNIQVRRLDSGEGDRRCWNPGAGTWGPASGPNAGYWAEKKAKNPDRGVFREMTSLGANGSTSTLTGFWINSNKTQDRGNLFDETSGYEIPWQHDEVLKNLWEMRRWQEKYNPVTVPLPHAAVPEGIFSDEPAESVRALVPDRFYLFRYPLNVGPRGREAPPSYKIFLQFFYDALEELERRLNADNPDAPIRIITLRDQSGAPKKAIFTAHGMRSSTLTALYAEGVPIAVLSKLVAGHATILMTLKYTKFEPAHVSELLTRARHQALSKAADNFPVFLAGATFAEAARMTARLRDDGLTQMKGAYEESSAWSRMDIGICPNGATLCNVGGEVLRTKMDGGRDKSTYKPVPGGPRNCVRCRFLVSGLPFLIPLWGHANLILSRIDQYAARIEQREGELARLKVERRDTTQRGDPVTPELKQRIAVIESEWDADSQGRDQAIADLHATLTIIEKVRAIREDADVDNVDGLPMLMPLDGMPEATARDSTRFELSDAVVQTSRFYPSLQSDDLERERDEFLNRVLYREGYVPITLAPLSVQERRDAADAMAALLLTELGAAEADNLIEGRKTLADLGLQDRLQDTVRACIGRPLDRMALPSPSRAPAKVLDIPGDRP